MGHNKITRNKGKGYKHRVKEGVVSFKEFILSDKCRGSVLKCVSSEMSGPEPEDHWVLLESDLRKFIKENSLKGNIIESLCHDGFLVKCRISGSKKHVIALSKKSARMISA